MLQCGPSPLAIGSHTVSDAPSLDVPKGLCIHSLELQIQNVPKGLIRDVRISFQIHRPNKPSLRCSSGFTPKSPFPSLESLLLESVETIKKEYKDDLNLQVDEG